MKHLYFVRHGLSEMNKQGVWSGTTETSLAPEGIEQCHEAGKALQDCGIDLIVSSPVIRAHDSAKIIASELGIPAEAILINDKLVERDFGPLEGATYRPNADLDSVDGVEHSSQLIERAAEVMKFLESLPAETILVVSHGSVGRAMRTAINAEHPFHGSAKFHNAQVVKLI